MNVVPTQVSINAQAKQNIRDIQELQTHFTSL
jgi:hypothetical protein